MKVRWHDENYPGPLGYVMEIIVGSEDGITVVIEPAADITPGNLVAMADAIDQAIARALSREDDVLIFIGDEAVG